MGKSRFWPARLPPESCILMARAPSGIGVFSLALLIAFMGVVIWFIGVPDITVIVVAVLLMAVYDFWRELSKPQK
jgi:hypothetical protein